MLNNNVLVDCGLIHKYLINKEDIEKIEVETFYNVEIVKTLSDYEVKNEADKLTLSNGSEVLVFKKVNNSYLKYMLDEF